MSSKASKELDELMVKVEGMSSKKEEEKPKEEPKQELDKEGDEKSPEEADMDSEENSEPTEEPTEEPIEEVPEEEPIGLKTDKIDYPDDSEEEEDMDSEAKKLPELGNIRDGGESENYDSEEGEDSEGDSNDKINALKQKSNSGMIEIISSAFKEKNPEHKVCCVMSDKIISLKETEAYETMFVASGDGVKFNSSIRNKELEESSASNDAIIAKILKFDNI